MEEQLSIPQRKKGKQVVIVLALVGVLLVSLGAGATYWYASGDITGTWRSTALENQLQQTMTTDMGTLLKEYNVTASDVISNPSVQLAVKDNAATMTLTYTFKKDAILNAYNQMLEEQYQSILSEIEALATENGVNKEEILKSQYGDDYETAIKSLFPSSDTLSSELDTMLKEAATNQKASYDSETGLVTLEAAKGQVDRWKHQLTNVEYIQSVEGLEWSQYQRSGNTLVFSQGSDVSFELVNE